MNTETVEAINKLTDAINHLASLITQNLGENNKAAQASQAPTPTPQAQISQSDLQTACLEAVRANSANKDKIKELMVSFSVRNILELNDQSRADFYQQMQKVITK